MSDLDSLIRRARAAYQAATLLQRKGMDAAQRRSWALGQLLLANPSMTYAEGERLVDNAIKGENA